MKSRKVNRDVSYVLVSDHPCPNRMWVMREDECGTNKTKLRGQRQKKTSCVWTCTRQWTQPLALAPEGTVAHLSAFYCCFYWLFVNLKSHIRVPRNRSRRPNCRACDLARCPEAYGKAFMLLSDIGSKRWVRIPGCCPSDRLELFLPLRASPGKTFTLRFKDRSTSAVRERQTKCWHSL